MAPCREPVGAFLSASGTVHCLWKRPSLCVHSHCENPSIVCRNKLSDVFLMPFLSKGSEGQDTKGELQEGAAVRHSPSERDPLRPLPAALPAASQQQTAVSRVQPLRLQKLQPRPPGRAGLALRPLPLGQVSSLEAERP